MTQFICMIGALAAISIIAAFYLIAPPKETTMAVRAKLKLTAITESKWHKDMPGSKVLKFSAQYDTSIPEDQRFQKATPNGTCEMQIDNPDALAQFELGQDYYVDFTPAS